MLLVADVVGDLAFQGGLQHPFGQLLQQPALAGRLQALIAGPVNQHRNELLVRHRTRRFLNLLLGLLVLHGGLDTPTGVSCGPGGSPCPGPLVLRLVKL